jgi:hypothetical protein
MLAGEAEHGLMGGLFVLVALGLGAVLTHRELRRMAEQAAGT